MPSATKKNPILFWVISILMLLWNLAGVSSFFYHLFIPDADLATMTDAEREIMVNYPLYVTAAFALAVFGGLIGCIGLLAKRKWAKSFFLVSFLGIVIQISHDIFMTPMMEVFGNGALKMPLSVLGIGLFLIWYSNLSIKKEWIH